MAVWALSRLLDETSLASLKDARHSKEADDGVRAEWDAISRPSG